MMLRKEDMENCICIHAHFYQPPRENPWLETIEYQESAHPYHDWNRRITAECYQPNSAARILDKDGRIDRIINNYARISFNIGPTLLSWLSAEDAPTYNRILEADKESSERFSGHGSALAQAYNHAILPLCNPRDKFTQIQWGLRDFAFRFGRQPEGMWIPETAVDLETLDMMAQMGIKFAILAPHQAKRVRKRGERSWRNTPNQSIDPTMAYEICLPTGRRMALFFYDGTISLAVGFQHLLSDGNNFVNRLMDAFSRERKWPQLVHIAVDGETFGHHHQFGDMALAYALNALESEKKVRLTNYGEFLEKNPPTHLVEIWEKSSWSCPHETGRWKEHCTCNTGAHPDWQQRWRAPLRKSLDELRDSLESLYDDDAIGFVKDPWAARNDYIDVILDRSPESIERFLVNHQTHALGSEGKIRTLKLLELQRHAMLMFTSCGWFFDDISGIETIQILQYAGRAIQLAEELFAKENLESSFLEILQKAQSNVPEMGNGRDLYNTFVKPAIIDQYKAAGHYAVRSLFQDNLEHSELYSYSVDRQSAKTVTCGHTKLVIGRCRITSAITMETSELDYAVVHFGDHNFRGGVQESSGKNQDPTVAAELTDAFEKADLPSVFRIIDKHFSPNVFSLKSLVRDEQRRILDMLLKSANADLEELNRLTYERLAPLMRFIMELKLTIPAHFSNIAAVALHSQLAHEFLAETIHAERIDDLFKSADSWHISLNKEELELTFRAALEKRIASSGYFAQDTTALKNFSSAIRLAQTLPFTVNLYRIQNSYYDLLQHLYPSMKKLSEKGDKNATSWTEEFLALGALLSVKVN
jgi:alpha-amylase/alpha-mannosidase (GH57 family)